MKTILEWVSVDDSLPDMEKREIIVRIVSDSGNVYLETMRYFQGKGLSDVEIIMFIEEGANGIVFYDKKNNFEVKNDFVSLKITHWAYITAPDVKYKCKNLSCLFYSVDRDNRPLMETISENYLFAYRCDECKAYEVNENMKKTKMDNVKDFKEKEDIETICQKCSHKFSCQKQRLHNPFCFRCWLQVTVGESWMSRSYEKDYLKKKMDEYMNKKPDFSKLKNGDFIHVYYGDRNEMYPLFFHNQSDACIHASQSSQAFDVFSFFKKQIKKIVRINQAAIFGKEYRLEEI